MATRKQPVTKKRIVREEPPKLGALGISFLVIFALIVLITFFKGGALLSATEYSIDDMLKSINEVIEVIQKNK